MVLEASSVQHKFKIFNDARIISQNTRLATLTISPAQLNAVQKEIGKDKEKAKSKKVMKPSKSIFVDVPNPKAKRKLVIEENDSEKTHLPHLVRNPRTQKTKPAASGSLPIMSAIQW